MSKSHLQSSADVENMEAWLMSTGLLDLTRKKLSKMCFDHSSKCNCTSAAEAYKQVALNLELNVTTSRELINQMLVTVLQESTNYGVKLPTIATTLSKQDSAPSSKTVNTAELQSGPVSKKSRNK
jgi:hypothetical protein